MRQVITGIGCHRRQALCVSGGPMEGRTPFAHPVIYTLQYLLELLVELLEQLKKQGLDDELRRDAVGKQLIQLPAHLGCGKQCACWPAVTQSETHS